MAKRASAATGPLGKAVRAYAKGEYPVASVVRFACSCARAGRATFAVEIAGIDAARVRCKACRRLTYIDDSKHYWRDNLEDNDQDEPDDAQCPCGGEEFRAAIGRAYHRGSRDTKWIYLGLACTVCSKAAVYADWHVV